VLLARFVLRDNGLAWLWSAWFATGSVASFRLMAHSAPVLRWSGVVALAIVVLPGLWLAWEALRARESP